MQGQADWATTAYRRSLHDETDFVRVRIRIDRGRVVQFTVQYEAVVEEETFPIVRYDSAHGTPHRDTLDRSSRVVAKDWLVEMSLAAALTGAIADIKANWTAYREEILRRTS